MRKLLTILLLLTCLQAAAKKRNYNWFNSESDWQRVKLENTLAVTDIKLIDTALIVASNREMQRDSLRFMSENRQEEQLYYFFVYVHDGIWHVLPTNTLYEALQYMPDKNKDWVVYTEGMGKVFTGDLDRGIRLSAYYDLNIILLDYPSISSKKKSLGNYFFAINNARTAYKDFAPVLDTIKVLREHRQMGNGSLSLFFHSMGNNVMEEIVENNKLTTINNTVWVDNLILNAPCVAQRRHKDWIEPINFAKNIYVHYNPEDKTLKLAHLVSFSKQLGEKVKHPVSSKAIYINFNTVADEGHSLFLPWSRSKTTDPAITTHYRTLFHGGTIAPGNSKNYAPTAYRKIGWDLLPTQQQESTAIK